jgi:hypothetical protein
MNSTPVLFRVTDIRSCVTLVLFAFCQAEAFENKSPTLAPTSGEPFFDHLRQALTFVMPPKKASVPGAAAL